VTSVLHLGVSRQQLRSYDAVIYPYKNWPGNFTVQLSKAASFLTMYGPLASSCHMLFSKQCFLSQTYRVMICRCTACLLAALEATMQCHCDKRAGSWGLMEAQAANQKSTINQSVFNGVLKDIKEGCKAVFQGAPTCLS